jgi:hypothetical protein
MACIQIYYFLRCYKDRGCEEYSSQHILSPSLTVTTDFYWALDHGNVEVIFSLLHNVRLLTRIAYFIKRAIQAVSDPLFDSEFPCKVLSALCAYKCFSEARLYLDSAQPPSETNEDQILRMQIMLRMGLSDAFLYQVCPCIIAMLA